jgi:hypothetical protein
MKGCTDNRGVRIECRNCGHNDNSIDCQSYREVNGLRIFHFKDDKRGDRR